MRTNSIRGVAALLSGILVLAAGHAQAGLAFKDGWWRLELSGGAGIHSGSRDRTGDRLIVGNVEYEIPATPRTTLGLRLLPLMVYDQDESREETVWGGGIGVAGRWYLQKSREYRGWFAEIQANALGHSGEIDGNSANFNFLTGAGIGYKFKNQVHLTFQYQHISNAGLSEHNSGANTLGLAFGFSF